MIPQLVEKDRCVPGKLTPDRDVSIPLPPLSIQCASVFQLDVKTSEEQLLLVDDEEFSVASLKIMAWGDASSMGGTI